MQLAQFGIYKGLNRSRYSVEPSFLAPLFSSSCVSWVLYLSCNFSGGLCLCAHTHTYIHTAPSLPCVGHADLTGT
jgi:hypothetical protein